MRAPGSPDDIPSSIEDWLRPPEWHRRAACAGQGHEAFIRSPKDRYEAAKTICASCEVRTECLEYALEDKDLTGCWGGTDDRERREMRRRAA
jgi:WhiB family redox-sensing transcriptional regulator